MLSLHQAIASPARRKPTGKLRQQVVHSTLLVSPRHLLADGVLCGAELAQPGADEPADAASLAWLLRAACQQAEHWQQLGAPALNVTVALPLHHVSAVTLPSQVEAALHSADLPGAQLELALAEADLAESEPGLLLLIAGLRDLGVGVAVDSQASWQTTRHVLRRVPLTALRLHPSLVQTAEADPETRAALTNMIRFAHASDATAVAVGVNTALQRDILGDLGCDAGQGSLFTDNLPAAAFHAALMKDGRSPAADPARHSVAEDFSQLIGR